MMHVEYRFTLQGYDVFIFQHPSEDTISYLSIDPDGRQSWSAPESRYMSLSADTKPTYHMKEGVARELVTQLLRLGVSPAERSKIEGQYEAQSKHLADLQRLIFQEKTR